MEGEGSGGGLGIMVPSSQKSHIVGMCLECRRAVVGRVLHWIRKNTSFSFGGMKEALRSLKVLVQSIFGRILFHFS